MDTLISVQLSFFFLIYKADKKTVLYSLALYKCLENKKEKLNKTSALLEYTLYSFSRVQLFFPSFYSKNLLYLRILSQSYFCPYLPLSPKVAEISFP